MADALKIAEAYRGLTTGDQDPPRPWAHMSHVGVTRVSSIGALEVSGFHEEAGFDVTTDAGIYRVTIRKIAN